jgi:serine/threonine-protein kinase
MLVGEAPFTGPSVQAIVARLMSEEPRSLGKQRKAIPEHVESAVQRALEKLPADRWATAREYADALHDGSATSMVRGAATTRLARSARAGGRWGERLRDPVVLGLALLAVAASLAAGWARTSGAGTTEQRPVRFAIPTSRNGSGSALGYSNLAISRDGQLAVYIGQLANGRNALMIRPMDDVNARPLPGTEGADNPFFSPDGRWVGFFRGNQIFKTSVEGGTPQLLATAPGTFNGASWSSTGVIVTSGNIGLFVIPEAGGAPRQLSKADRSKGEVFQDAPVVLDEAKGVLYSSWRGSNPGQARLAFASLETGETTILDVLGVTPLGVVDGALVYVTIGSAVMAVPFDASKLKVRGTPVQIGSDVYVNNTSGLARAALSRTGTLFYESGTHVSQVVRVDLRGASQIVLAEPREYAYPRYSPDGAQLALTIGTSDQRDVWLYDVASAASTRFTTQSPTNERPEWTPDGKRVLYRTDRGGVTAIWWRPADLSAEAQPLLSREGDSFFEAVISPDGRYVAYQLDTAGADVYYQAIEGDRTPKPVANSAAIEIMPRISPDGRWIAFVTDESGTNQVVVQPFPGPGARAQLSTAGGSEPVWSRDGTRVFYRAEGRLIAARVRTAPSFGVIGRDTLFVDDYAHSTNPHANFDASPDGTHLLMLKPVSLDEKIVVTNWGAILKERLARKPGS